MEPKTVTILGISCRIGERVALPPYDIPVKPSERGKQGIVCRALYSDAGWSAGQHCSEEMYPYERLSHNPGGLARYAREQAAYYSKSTGNLHVAYVVVGLRPAETRYFIARAN